MDDRLIAAAAKYGNFEWFYNDEKAEVRKRVQTSFNRAVTWHSVAKSRGSHEKPHS
jgi:hypothetical protein